METLFDLFVCLIWENMKTLFFLVFFRYLYLPVVNRTLCPFSFHFSVSSLLSSGVGS